MQETSQTVPKWTTEDGQTHATAIQYLAAEASTPIAGEAYPTAGIEGTTT